MSRIVCVSGFFNPLHRGHLDLFWRASAFGKLHVIVNSDAQLRLKNSVPLLGESTRLEIVRDLRMVESACIAIDLDSSVSETLKKVKPHIFINGGDRKGDNLNQAEIDVCKAIRCEYMCLISDKIDSSSTIIENAVKWYQENRK